MTDLFCELNLISLPGSRFPLVNEGVLEYRYKIVVNWRDRRKAEE